MTDSWVEVWVDAGRQAGLPRGSSAVEPFDGQTELEVEPCRVALRHERGVATIGCAPIDDDRWQALVDAVVDRPPLVAALLTGTLPIELVAAGRAVGVELAPTPTELHADCTCRPEATSCRHLGDLVGRVGGLVGRDPWLVLGLRGRTRSELVGEVRARRGPAGRETTADTVEAGIAFATDRSDAHSSAPPAPPLPPHHRPRSLRSRPPPRVDAGLGQSALAGLAFDAATRALAVLDGGSSGLTLDRAADLARRASATDADGRAHLAEVAGIELAELERRAIAHEVGGAAGVAAIGERLEVDQGRLDPGAAVLSDRPKRRANSVRSGGRQLVLDRRDRWWALVADDRLGWVVVDGPAGDPGDLVFDPTLR